ncbi:hypothetical protein F2Q70_00008872 [Brassica cretica]|uniref:Uncharacterized protein n=1 Tax=Brassica cretica TaxID=69181 RepID=A0A8S9LXY9_BRACR|nr:hypothetical protein F2Q70_00008872 [Brassica cretica]
MHMSSTLTHRLWSFSALEKLLVLKHPMAGATPPAQNAIESFNVDSRHSHVNTAITTTQLELSGYPPIAQVYVFIKLMSQLEDLHSPLLYIVHAELLQHASPAFLNTVSIQSRASPYPISLIAINVHNSQDLLETDMKITLEMICLELEQLKVRPPLMSPRMSLMSLIVLKSKLTVQTFTRMYASARSSAMVSFAYRECPSSMPIIALPFILNLLLSFIKLSSGNTVLCF